MDMLVDKLIMDCRVKWNFLYNEDIVFPTFVVGKLAYKDDVS